MELVLTRLKRTSQSTVGNLLVNGIQECFTLEDIDRQLSASMPTKVIQLKKVYGSTAIPTGRYQIVVDFSNRFKKRLPLLLNVPGFAGIRIHSGNTSADTEGCILVGTTTSEDFVGNSRIAFANLFSKIERAMQTEKVFITIK